MGCPFQSWLIYICMYVITECISITQKPHFTKYCMPIYGRTYVLYKTPCSRDCGQLLSAGALHPGHLDTLSVSEGKAEAVSGQGNRRKFEMSVSG